MERELNLEPAGLYASQFELFYTNISGINAAIFPSSETHRNNDSITLDPSKICSWILEALEKMGICFKNL